MDADEFVDFSRVTPWEQLRLLRGKVLLWKREA